MLTTFLQPPNWPCDLRKFNMCDGFSRNCVSMRFDRWFSIRANSVSANASDLKCLKLRLLTLVEATLNL